MNKFMSSGKFYTVEQNFKNLVFFNKSNKFFSCIYEAIELLRPTLDIKVYILKKRGKKRSVKKGKKVIQNIKIIPIEVTELKSYKLAFKWLVKGVKNKGYNFQKSLILEIKDIYFKSFNSKALSYKKEIYNIASINRSFYHFGKKKKALIA